MLTGQDAANVESALGEVRGLGSGRVEGATFDLAQPEAIAPALAGVGQVRHLVLVAIDRDANTVAGLRHRPRDPARDAQARRLHGGRAHAPRPPPESASLVLFGGMAKERPYPGSTTVSTVNGGVVGLTRSLVEELRPRRVNSIHPGIVGDSPFWAAKPEAIASYASQTPTGRLATMADIVDATVVPAREPVGQRRRPPRRQRLALPLRSGSRPMGQGIDAGAGLGRGDATVGVRDAAGSRDAGRAREAQRRMGERLRVARQGRRLSLRDLAERLGVSASLISQIETGRANPSVGTLYALVAELDVSLDELLFGDRRAPMGASPHRPDALEGVLQRREARTVIRLATGVTWERLTPSSEPGTEFLFVTYDAGGVSSVDGFQRHNGHEWGYVLEGMLDVRIGFDDLVLRPGDAISFDSTTPHRLSNSGTIPVRAIWFVSGRTAGEDPTRS